VLLLRGPLQPLLLLLTPGGDGALRVDAAMLLLQLLRLAAQGQQQQKGPVVLQVQEGGSGEPSSLYPAYVGVMSV